MTTATTPETSYALRPLSVAQADHLRGIGGPLYVADATPGFPCRVCLRDADIGERLILVSHDPFDDMPDSPYAGASPIFVHEDACSPVEGQALPTQLTGRQLLVKSYNDDALMINAMAIDGQELDAAIDRLFADPDSTWLHVHNSPRGCWAVSVDRI